MQSLVRPHCCDAAMVSDPCSRCLSVLVYYRSVAFKPGDFVPHSQTAVCGIFALWAITCQFSEVLTIILVGCGLLSIATQGISVDFSSFRWAFSLEPTYVFSAYRGSSYDEAGLPSSNTNLKILFRSYHCCYLTVRYSSCFFT